MYEQTNSSSCNTQGSEAPVSSVVVRGISNDCEAIIDCADMHCGVIRGALSDAYTFSKVINAFPNKVVVDLSDAIRALFANKILGNYISEIMVVSCIDMVAFSLNEKYDFFDHIYSCVESCVNECLDDAANNGNLPQGEDDDSGDDELLNANLTEHVVKFCINTRDLLMQSNIPSVEWIGMPYEVIEIKPTGNVVFLKRTTDEAIHLVFG